MIVITAIVSGLVGYYFGLSSGQKSVASLITRYYTLQLKPELVALQKNEKLIQEFGNYQ